jgi:hypothetical protein
MDDPEFEAYIGRRSHLSRRYQDLKVELPPKELDEAVLSRARSAHSLKRTELPERTVFSGWMAPVAFAATVVLVFTVVLQIVIRPQIPARLESDTDRHSAVAPSAEPVPAQHSNAIADNAPPGKSAASTSAERRIAGEVASEGAASAALDRAKAAAPQPTEAVELETPVVVAQSSAESKLAKKSEVASPASATVTPAAGALSTARGVGGYSPTADSEELHRDPKAWLAEIEQLRKSGQTAVADQQMKLFLHKYPDYFRTHPLPDEAR